MSKSFPCSTTFLDLGRGGGGVPLVGSVSHGGGVSPKPNSGRSLFAAALLSPEEIKAYVLKLDVSLWPT